MKLRRLALVLAALVWAAVVAQACAQSPAGLPAAVAAAPFSKNAWTVARAWCPVGCSAATRQTLQAQLGRQVLLSPTQVVAPFVDACSGQVVVDVRSVQAQAIVADVNKGLAPGRPRLAAADLGVAGQAPAGPALSGWALCRGAAGDMNLLRLLLLGPDRVLLLSEEQSLIELR